MALDLVTPFTKVQLEEEIKDTGRKQVGILGGNFNPVHNAHLVVADQVRQQLGLDEVLLMPEFEPPHIDKKETIDEKHRLNMLMLAINGIPGLDIETIELERKGISYTYDTMKLLTEANPDTDYYFIIGADMVEYLPKWHRIDELIEMVQFVGVQLLYGKVLYPAIHAENFHLFRRSVEYLYVHGVVLVDIFSIELTITQLPQVDDIHLKTEISVQWSIDITIFIFYTLHLPHSIQIAMPEFLSTRRETHQDDKQQ